ncbi:MAG TPA: glycosyltransferase [Verrucomicrobiae bacterium]|jgi:glycosyltransferase involved in cell wall biosynthesis|nr:glycosyltransferase [Verrucomicrobiae bacterium]
MRHLHFTQSLEPLQGGGLGSSAMALHGQLRANGEHSLLCSTRGGCVPEAAPGVLEYSRVKPDFVYFSPAMREEGTRLVRDADIIHGHGLYVGTNFIFGREARRQSKPLVYHTHGFFEPYILGRSRWKKRLAHWLFEDANIRHVRLWRALTGKEADQIRACGYTAPIVVAPNGLNLDYYRPAESLPEPIQTSLAMLPAKQKKRLLFLGRIHPKKGLDLLLPAWAGLKRRHEEWELIIAGPDEQSYGQTVRALARSLGIEDKVLFVGTVTGKAKLALLHSADLFILPSYSEGMPMSLLEAMACGIPVLATRMCNIPDIGLSGAGWDCDARWDSLAEVLGNALESTPSELRERGAKGRRLVEAKYSWPSILGEFLKACAAHC